MPAPNRSLRLLGVIVLVGVAFSAPSAGFSRTTIVDLPIWRVEPAEDGSERRVIQLPYEQASYDISNHVLLRRVVDRNEDGVSDRIITYEGFGGARIEEIDTDFNGAIDRWDTFGTEGERLRSATARVGDRPDRIATYDRTGLLSTVETDSDLDGNFEHVQVYEKGALAETRIDSDNNGRVDRIRDYRPGYLAAEDFDTDEDGAADLRMTYTTGGALLKVTMLKNPQPPRGSAR